MKCRYIYAWGNHDGKSYKGVWLSQGSDPGSYANNRTSMATKDCNQDLPPRKTTPEYDPEYNYGTQPFCTLTTR